MHRIKVIFILTRTNDRAISHTIVRKGKDTKNIILDAGIDLASQYGLECVSIGVLSKAIHMSKSGLFAHFHSKENLQLAILDHAAGIFVEKVLIPTVKTQAGIPRIRSLVKNWVSWSSTISGGCIFVTASTDFSDRPGKVRDLLLAQQEQWIGSIRRTALSAIKVGDFREDINCEQFAFDLYSLLLGYHLYYRLLNDTDTLNHLEVALVRLLDNYKSSRAQTA